MTQLKISIVTPSLNQAAFLEETIQSVINQHYPNLEYVVIDGGSTDGSVEIIKKYKKNLKYWVSEIDRGHGDALNKGFSHTTGEIMAWINSDDKYTPWAFKTVAEIFARHPDVMWITGLNSLWNDKGAMIEATRVPKNIYDFLNGDYEWVQQESVFWRRSLWERAGGYINDNYKLMIDGELWTRFFLHERLYLVDCILGGYRSHPDNRACHHADVVHQEMQQAIKEMKKNCNKEVLNRHSQLKRFIWARKQMIFKQLPISWLSKLFADPAVLKKTEHDNIFYFAAQSDWVKRRLPFIN